MDDGEGSNLDGRDEARPQFPVQNFSDLPPKLTPAAATEMFVRELKGALQTYEQNQAAGVASANYAALRLCYALGCSELVEPFHDLAVSLWDLKHGRPASPLFKPARPDGEKGSTKPTAQWRTIANACACLHVLMKEAKIEEEAAARTLARALNKKGIKFGQSKTETWESLINSRHTLIEGRCPEIATETFWAAVAEITEGFNCDPSCQDEEFVLEVLDLIVEPKSKKSESR